MYIWLWAFSRRYFWISSLRIKVLNKFIWIRRRDSEKKRWLFKYYVYIIKKQVF